jgi:type VI protein secretion system component Hcp
MTSAINTVTTSEQEREPAELTAEELDQVFGGGVQTAELVVTKVVDKSSPLLF